MKKMRQKNPLMLTITAVLVFVIASMGNVFNNDSSIPEHLQQLETATVKRVVDGDTVVLDSGEKVRLILINAPESVHNDPSKNTPMGEASSTFLKKLLTGETVYLEKDVSDQDPYGRLLRYLWLSDGTLINAYIVEQGYARCVEYPPDLKYLDRIRSAENTARENGRGIWE